MDEPTILLTNDDGIDAVGLEVLYEALGDVGEVTAVAPAIDQSAVGRAMSFNVTVSEHELGYAIEGTPADCVIAGLESLVPDADVVVAGCNEGANLGEYTLGRSGTVSAAVEATFFDVPAMAFSMYYPVDSDIGLADMDVARHQFQEAARAATYLTEHAPDAGVFDQADYLNVNAPVTERATGEIAVTRPSEVHLMEARRSGDNIELTDPIWAMMSDGDIPDPEGTDRRAVVEGKVSVSPLTAPHATEHHEALDGLVAAYPAE
jgi:5'-nucleotidase